MKEFHHVGIPTDVKRENETYVADCKAYITDFEKHPYRVEWVRVEPGCTMPEEIQKIPHVAFKVDDIKAEIEGKNVIIEPFSPLEGITAAFILTEDGAPIEFIQTD